jgi:nitrile hydratase accessory protein
LKRSEPVITGSDVTGATIPGITRDGEEPHFFAPWQAKVFGLTLGLAGAGVFTWAEWVAVFSSHIAAGTEDGAAIGAGEGTHLPGADDPAPHAEVYFRHWLAALEEILAAKGLAQADQVQELSEGWQRAARATPHGQPILYENGL